MSHLDKKKSQNRIPKLSRTDHGFPSFQELSQRGSKMPLKRSISLNSVKSRNSVITKQGSDMNCSNSKQEGSSTLQYMRKVVDGPITLKIFKSDDNFFFNAEPSYCL